jgi:hypothetical protein
VPLKQRYSSIQSLRLSLFSFKKADLLLKDRQLESS